MEELITLFKLPFEILATVSGETAFGYSLIMILFGSGVVSLIYYVLNFILKIFKATLQFFLGIVESFTSIFKNQSISKKELRSELIKLNDKIDNLNSDPNLSIFP